MRWLLILLLTAYTFEAPQIWTLDGASLSDSRLQIEERLGRSRADRPLKRSFAGETWEYRYANGLKVDFRDRDRGRHAMCLVGRKFFSRGRLMCQAGVTRARFVEVMGAAPLAEDDDQVVYFDDGRHAYLTGYFVEGKAREFVLSRFRVDQ
ncbi:hypothetical protein ABS71_13010 [bacterium SCN 62-11]|nr:hypothetical protein [Candidatus Eremiobacteraeota bacterium]ODT64622.1 MAG: hypothetical protein ABS71_13010 [bacterium SCN 62-11]